MTTTQAPHTPEIKEQYAYILDYLPTGHAEDTRPIHLRKPLAQALGADYFILLELSIKEGERVEIESRVFVGKGERDVVKHVERRMKYDEITHTAKIECGVEARDESDHTLARDHVQTERLAPGEQVRVNGVLHLLPGYRRGRVTMPLTASCAPNDS